MRGRDIAIIRQTLTGVQDVRARKVIFELLEDAERGAREHYADQREEDNMVRAEDHKQNADDYNVILGLLTEDWKK